MSVAAKTECGVCFTIHRSVELEPTRAALIVSVWMLRRCHEEGVAAMRDKLCPEHRELFERLEG